MRFRGILLSDEPIVANTVHGRDQLPLYPGLSCEIRTLRHRYVTDNCGRATLDSNKLLTTPHILNGPIFWIPWRNEGFHVDRKWQFYGEG
jgi:hypothetical protein